MKIFYGWTISVLSMAGNFMLQGIALYCMNAFMEPLSEVNGWSRLAINSSLGFAVLMGQLAMPVAAAIANKTSLRLLMTLGALAGGLSICAMGLTANIHLFTVCMVILWVSSQFCGGVVANALMSNWFSHFRGLAFGLANSGASFAGILLPLLALFLIRNAGLRSAYLILGIATCLLAPLCWALIRSTPAAMHLFADGRRHAPRARKTVHFNACVGTLLRSPAVWFIGVAFGLGLMAGSGLTSQLKPRFSDLGITPYTAMTFASMAAFSGTIAKYFWGMICDRFSPIIASRLVMLTFALSFLFLKFPASHWSLAAFAISFSFCSGGLWVALPAVVSSYFGAANFLAVYRIISIFIILRCAGFPIMGISHEINGNYDLADIFFCCSLLGAFVLTMLLNPAKSLESGAKRKHSGQRRLHS